jgi:glucose/arabinose dehydrogenase
MKCRNATRLAVGCLALLALALPAHAAAVNLPSGFQDTVVLEGLDEPTNFRFAPDGKIFVAEKAGKILVFDSLSDTEPEVFADLRTEVFDNGDRGILGLALDPEFPTKPYVYVLYTYDHMLGDSAPAPKWGQPNQAGDPCPLPPEAEADDCPVSGRLVRLTAEGDHAAPSAEAPGEDVLVEGWCQQFSSHSIGDLQFDSEGALYASGGEGASFTSPDYGQYGWPQVNQCGDPPGVVGEALSPPTAEGGSLRSQNPTNLDGKIIRIDPETGEGLPTNPLATSLNQNERRIVAEGLRNPFRFTIDPQTHEIYVDNVGWGTYEEMDRFAGDPSEVFNSGWPCFEGPEHTFFDNFELNVCKALYETPGSTAPPFFYYDHTKSVAPEDTCPHEDGSAITGLSFYDGETFPSTYDGALFFADSVRGCIYAMFPGEDGRPDPSTVTPFLTEGGLYPAVDIEMGPEGNLFYADLFTEGYESGDVHRISYSSGNQPPVANLTVDHEYGAKPLEVEFDASESEDADGDPLTYEWDLNEDGTFEELGSNDETVTQTYNDEENHTVAVKVKDPSGASSVDRVTVYPGDTPPEPEILEPEESGPESEAGFKWHVGEPIHFEGEATDNEDGTLPGTSLGWSSRLFHCPFSASDCHTHLLQAFPAVASGTLIAPDHDYPSHIVLILTATDSRGLRATKTVSIYPHTVDLEFTSDPVGPALSAGLLSQPGPFTLRVIEDAHITLAAPQAAEVGGKKYSWVKWSDGGARVHSITAESAAEYKASYAEVPAEPAPPGKGSEPPAGKPLRVQLSGHPSKKTSKSTARFVFSAGDSGATFRCKLDGGRFKPCSSPHTYRRLKPGRHVFEVEAVASGTPDSPPVSFRWKVAAKTHR